MESWLERSDAVARRLLDHARKSADGHLVWLDPSADEPARLGPHLYTGTCGLALFFAARSRWGGGDDDRAVALATLAPLEAQLDRLADSPELAARQSFALGALVGLGGYLYAFLRVADWTGEERCLATARRIATLVTPERIAADRRLDVAHGAAGCLLMLLALDRRDPGARDDGATPLDLAVVCGEHLLARQSAVDDLPRAWAAPGRPPLCGLAHGATGIAWALAALAERTGRDDFRAAAREGLEFERALFDPDAGAWRVAPGVPRCWTNWCNGSVGVGLGRLEMIPLDDDPRLTDEAETAVAAVAEAAPSELEHLCCGNLGRAELLREAGAAAEADDITDGVLDRLAEPGAGADDLSLFRGLAGAGYAALRVVAPDLPCVTRFG